MLLWCNRCKEDTEHAKRSMSQLYPEEKMAWESDIVYGVMQGATGDKTVWRERMKCKRRGHVRSEGGCSQQSSLAFP